MKIHFAGAGNMARSLVGGLIAKGMAPESISLFDPDQAKLDQLSKQYGVTVAENNIVPLSTAEVVILAVKPQIMARVAQEIGERLPETSPLFISIAAGISTAALCAWLGSNVAVVRCMPNTPALIQSGATGLFAGPGVSSGQKEQAFTIMSAVGLALWVEQEAQLDAVTALSGSGPAYFFLVMEALMEAGQSLGLTPDMARQLTLQTALGASQLAIVSEEAPWQLRTQVTSPGGTTEAALKCFERRQLKSVFKEALQAACTRAEELTRL